MVTTGYPCMASAPSSADLLSINGVGEAKLERYGRAFLEVIEAA
jgi:superfamily II DNA helicase RecQ